MIHYHGTPITPRSVLTELAGANFCVSYAAPFDVEYVHKIGQSVMLDNGAFTFWRTGKPVDWEGYYEWVEPWLDFHTTWAVIPDVIDGTAEENDALIEAWPYTDVQSAPVWHMNETLDRLGRLSRDWPRVCIGSSGEYAEVRTPRWHYRITEAFNYLCPDGPPPCWLHMLRGMALSGDRYPFASVDSTDVARNHNRPQNTAAKLVKRWDGLQTPARWTYENQAEQIRIEAA